MGRSVSGAPDPEITPRGALAQHHYRWRLLSSRQMSVPTGHNFVFPIAIETVRPHQEHTCFGRRAQSIDSPSSARADAFMVEAPTFASRVCRSSLQRFSVILPLPRNLVSCELGATLAVSSHLSELHATQDRSRDGGFLSLGCPSLYPLGSRFNRVIARTVEPGGGIKPPAF